MIIMEQRTLSIAGALIELKLLEKRINRATNSSFVSFKKGKELPAGYKDVNEVENAIKGNYQSVLDLIELRNTIKSKIVISNANTEVTVGSKKMTVAEAIERKTSIEHEKALLGALKADFRKVSTELVRHYYQVKAKANALAESFLGRDTDKAVVAEAQALSESHYSSNEGKLIDPIGIVKAIEDLEHSIEEFESNVDLALTVSNAKVEITI